MWHLLDYINSLMQFYFFYSLTVLQSQTVTIWQLTCLAKLFYFVSSFPKLKSNFRIFKGPAFFLIIFFSFFLWLPLLQFLAFSLFWTFTHVICHWILFINVVISHLLQGMFKEKNQSDLISEQSVMDLHWIKWCIPRTSYSIL